MALPPDHVRQAQPPSGDGGTAFPPLRRRRHPRALDVVLLVVVVWLLVCGATLRRARSEAERGIDAVERAEDMVSPGELVDGAALEPLGEAGAAFGRARRDLDSPALLPLKVLPVVGRQVRSARALTAAATDIASLGVRAVGEVGDALDQPRGTGPERVTLLRRLGEAAAKFSGELSDIDLGPDRALVGPLAERRTELADRLGDVRDAMGKGATVAAGLADLLAGPGRYLLLGANNAEMRAGSGMFLSIGVLSFADGTMTLSDFRPTGDVTLEDGTGPPIEDADLAARWGWLDPNIEFRNLAASPRFPPNAALAARMWAARGEPAVDGVLALDPVAVRGLLSATGPVTIGGRTVSEDDVVQLLLHDQYATIESGNDPDQAARREMLGLIALATFEAVQQEGADVAALATALGDAAAGRHLLAWSPERDRQEMWEVAGVAGRLEERSLAVGVLNRAGNKIDPFLHVEARLDVEPAGEGSRAELRVVLRNATPEGESPYVAGLRQVEGVRPGDYRGLLSLTLPGFVDDVVIEGDPPLAAVGPDGPTNVVALPLLIERGATVTSVVRFRLPRTGSLVVEPSARVPAVRWSAEGQSWESGPRHQVRW